MGGCCYSKPSSDNRQMIPTRHMTSSGKIVESGSQGAQTMIGIPFPETDQRPESGMCPPISDFTGSSRKKRIKSLEQDVKELHDVIDGRIKVIDELKRQRSEISKENALLREENDTLKTRLSRLTSDRLTDNNPTITDLSDPNRPMKLAEKFSELYCNEWTDAFETLSKDGKYDDDDAVKVLLTIVTELYREYRKKADEELLEVTKAVKRACGVSEMPIDVASNIKQVKDLRKKYCVNAFKRSINKVMTDVKKKFVKESLEKAKSVCAYTKSVAELCWLMSIQDPPVYMICSIEQDGPFDKDLFSEFTKRGDVYNFLVWPALLNEKGGQLLHKGVAQAKQSSMSTKHSGERGQRHVANGRKQTRDFDGNLSQVSMSISVTDQTKLSVRSVTSRSSQTEDLSSKDSSQRSQHSISNGIIARKQGERIPSASVGSRVSFADNLPNKSASTSQAYQRQKTPDSFTAGKIIIVNRSRSKSECLGPRSMLERIPQVEVKTASQSVSCRSTVDAGSSSEEGTLKGQESTRL